METLIAMAFICRVNFVEFGYDPYQRKHTYIQDPWARILVEPKTSEDRKFVREHGCVPTNLIYC